MPVVTIIQTRMNSSRLPGSMLIGTAPMLQRLIERVSSSESDGVVVDFDTLQMID